MTAIHEFECNSCKLKVEAKYNGEHYLPPDTWTALQQPINLQQWGHLCDECTCVALHKPLRVYFGKWLKRFLK